MYGHINPITKKFFYIGKGEGKRSQSKSGRSEAWFKEVEEFGIGIVKLIDGLNHEQAIEIERQYIRKYGLRKHGGSLVNLTYCAGSTPGYKLSEETKMKMSISKIGNTPSLETKIKISKSKLGSGNPNYKKRTWNFGIPRTEEEKRKMSASKIGVKQSKENRLKSLAALEKAKRVRKEQMRKVKCLLTNHVWKNRWDCIEGLRITLSQFKQMIRGDRGVQKLEYINN